MGLYSIGPSYCCMILEKWYNLKDAKMVGVNMDCANLAGAIMPDGTIHE